MKAPENPPVKTAHEALRDLVNKLEHVHDSSAYQAVWLHWQNHFGPYPGPQYKDELAAAKITIAPYIGTEEPRARTLIRMMLDAFDSSESEQFFDAFLLLAQVVEEMMDAELGETAREKGAAQS